MKPLEQTRIGDEGNCFATCLASILETGIPEFGLTSDKDYWQKVDKWLALKGLRYRQVPIGGAAPLGYHTIEGISPRGGMHAVVGLDGEFVHDPHPMWDDKRRGLVKPMYYGLLLPTTKAEDVGGVSIVCATNARNDTYELHREGCAHLRSLFPHGVPKTYSSAYAALSEWRSYYDRQGDATRIVLAACLRGAAKDRADMQALRRNTQRQGGPFHVQLTEPDGREHTESVHALKAYDEVQPIPPFNAGDAIKLANGKRTAVRKITLARNLLDEPEWHILTTSGDIVTVSVRNSSDPYK